MKKILLIIVVLISGCSHLELTPRSNHQDVAHRFLTALLEKRLDDSYELFSVSFQQHISLDQHKGLWTIATDRIGPLQDYEKVMMPFVPPSDLEAYLMKGKDPHSVHVFHYDLEFEDDVVTARIIIVEEQGENRIGLFELRWVSFESDPAVQGAVKALGL